MNVKKIQSLQTEYNSSINPTNNCGSFKGDLDSNQTI